MWDRKKIDCVKSILKVFVLSELCGIESSQTLNPGPSKYSVLSELCGIESLAARVAATLATVFCLNYVG